MAITSISIVSASSRPSVFFLALLLFVLVFDCQAGGRSQLINNLKQDKPQTVVAYGTSLTEGGAWVDQLQAVLDARYPGMATVINSGKAGMWSTWGVENLEERVIQKRPDTVFIEFAINDAHVANHVSLAQAKANLETMISRIHTANRRCEIMLMTMNPPVGGNLERRPQIEAYYQMYRDVAKKYKLPLIDHERHWQRLLEQDKTLFDQYLPDGLHPTGEGCRQVILPGMVEALWGYYHQVSVRSPAFRRSAILSLAYTLGSSDISTPKTQKMFTQRRNGATKSHVTLRRCVVA